MSEFVAIENLHKSFSGKMALRGVDMVLKSGQVIGLLGPNGSGKTTLLKAMAGLLHPNVGTIQMLNHVTGLAAKETIAFMPDAMFFPRWMRVYETFRYTKDMYAGYDQDLADKMISLLALNPQDRIVNLSKGMQERVALGTTLSRKASLYLLDEPLGGIDPVGKARIMDAILAMELVDASIVVSTHLIRDIERIFDSVFMIGDGKVLYQGDCDQIRQGLGKSIEQVYLEVFSYA